MDWSPEKAIDIIDEVFVDFDESMILSNNKDKIIIRYKVKQDNSSIIIKLWSRPHLGGRIRKWLNLSQSDKEWSAILYANSLGINVPKAFIKVALPMKPKGFTDAIIMEDLGDISTALDHIKDCIDTTDDEKIFLFEEKIIKMTATLINNALLDTDHTLFNIVVNESGIPFRLDFELAKKTIFPSLFFYQYGQLIGNLLASYTYAVQPQVERVPLFYKKLCSEVNASKLTLWIAKRKLKKSLDYQAKRYGIDSNVSI